MEKISLVSKEYTGTDLAQLDNQPMIGCLGGYLMSNWSRPAHISQSSLGSIARLGLLFADQPSRSSYFWMQNWPYPNSDL